MTALLAIAAAWVRHPHCSGCWLSLLLELTVPMPCLPGAVHVYREAQLPNGILLVFNHFGAAFPLQWLTVPAPRDASDVEKLSRHQCVLCSYLAAHHTVSVK
jgi:hypothetical protein